uniref:Mitochondrial glutathione transporter SLC25A39 n=1 Tax=Sinocyclocheilus rhinocerous TaxID=307959 RepID=A0A673N6I0_9TELE
MGEGPAVRPSAAITPVQQMLASGSGAVLTSLFVTPLDVVKIRLQAQQAPLYKGTDIKLFIIYFTCYDQLRDFLRYSMGYQGDHIPLIAGGLARLGAVSVISPLELVRTKMQSRKLPYSELMVCIHSAVAQDGWLSLWRGWGPTVLRDVPFSALYWFNYELVKAQLCEWYRAPQTSFTISFTAGAVSGAIAAILTLPFDVVKTRKQIQLGEMEALGVVSVKKPSSTWNMMRNIWIDMGYRGLFAGFLPRVIKVAPACAVMISTYEFGKTFFQERNLNQARCGL